MFSGAQLTVEHSSFVDNNADRGSHIIVMLGVGSGLEVSNSTIFTAEPTAEDLSDGAVDVDVVLLSGDSKMDGVFISPGSYPVTICVGNCATAYDPETETILARDRKEMGGGTASLLFRLEGDHHAQPSGGGGSHSGPHSSEGRVQGLGLSIRNAGHIDYLAPGRSTDHTSQHISSFLLDGENASATLFSRPDHPIALHAENMMLHSGTLRCRNRYNMAGDTPGYYTDFPVIHADGNASFSDDSEFHFVMEGCMLVVHRDSNDTAAEGDSVAHRAMIQGDIHLRNHSHIHVSHGTEVWVSNGTGNSKNTRTMNLIVDLNTGTGPDETQRPPNIPAFLNETRVALRVQGTVWMPAGANLVIMGGAYEQLRGGQLVYEVEGRACHSEPTVQGASAAEVAAEAAAEGRGKAVYVNGGGAGVADAAAAATTGGSSKTRHARSPVESLLQDARLVAAKLCLGCVFWPNHMPDSSITGDIPAVVDETLPPVKLFLSHGHGNSHGYEEGCGVFGVLPKDTWRLVSAGEIRSNYSALGSWGHLATAAASSFPPPPLTQVREGMLIPSEPAGHIVPTLHYVFAKPGNISSNTTAGVYTRVYTYNHRAVPLPTDYVYHLESSARNVYCESIFMSDVMISRFNHQAQCTRCRMLNASCRVIAKKVWETPRERQSDAKAKAYTGSMCVSKDNAFCGASSTSSSSSPSTVVGPKCQSTCCLSDTCSGHGQCVTAAAPPCCKYGIDDGDCSGNGECLFAGVAVEVDAPGFLDLVPSCVCKSIAGINLWETRVDSDMLPCSVVNELWYLLIVIVLLFLVCPPVIYWYWKRTKRRLKDHERDEARTTLYDQLLGTDSSSRRSGSFSGGQGGGAHHHHSPPQGPASGGKSNRWSKGHFWSSARATFGSGSGKGGTGSSSNKKKVGKKKSRGKSNSNGLEMYDQKREVEFLKRELALQQVQVPLKEISFVRKAGEGGYGIVYQAAFRGTDVAVKMMKWMPFITMDDDLHSFREEAYLMTCLRHPNVVLTLGLCLTTFAEMDSLLRDAVGHSSLRDTGVEYDDDDDDDAQDDATGGKRGTLCIVTEWCENGSLWDVLQTPSTTVDQPYRATARPTDLATPPPNDRDVMDVEWVRLAMLSHPMRDFGRILRCALDAARGMQCLHSMQPPVLHRDLKSANLLVTSSWGIKVRLYNDVFTSGVIGVISGRVQQGGFSTQIT